MPINANNQVKIKPEPTEQDKLVARIVNILNSKETFLLVDGKIKKIGKKSKYLLDMLTSED